MLPCIKYICHAILLRYFLLISHALFNICYHRCSVFCLSTSVDLIPVCSIVRFSPRCSLPSFPVMPTGLLLALLLQNHSLLWRHCLHHLACNFVLSRCSSGIRAEFGTALRIDNPEDAWFCQARGPAIRMSQKEDICQALPTLAFTFLLPAYDGAITIAFSLHVVWRTVLFLQPFLPCTRLHPRDLLLDLSSPLGLALRLSRSCLPMPPGSLCHVGGWHLRSKPCVDFSFLRLPWSPRHPHISAVFMSVVWLPCCLGRFMLSMTVPRRPTRNFLSRDNVLRDFHVK